MAANNVFQMLAQQEMERPQRELQKMQAQAQQMQLSKLMADQAYQDKARIDLAAGQTGPQPAPGSIAALNPRFALPPGATIDGDPPQAKPLTIADQFKRQYDYHMQNGRADLAQGVMEHQLELSEKAAKVADHAYKVGGREGLAAWLQNNPTFAPLLGDPSHMKLEKEGVLYPASGPDGVPVPGEYWYRDANGKVAFKTVKPEQVQTFAPGVGISDGKGGYTVPVPAAAKPDQEALLDKRIEAQDRRSAAQIAAQDRRTQSYIAAADRRAASGGGHGGGKDKPPFGYRFLPNGDLEAIPGGPASPDGKAGGKILPAGQLESIADMKRVKDVLAEARDLIKTRKIDTGPVSGRLQSLGSKVGLASDDFVNLQQKMQTAENIMLKLRSGAAVTESEYQRFKKEFPRTADTPEVRNRKMNNAINYATTLMDDKMSIYEEGGYRVPQSVKSGGKAQSKAPNPKPIVTKGGFKVTVVQ